MEISKYILFTLAFVFLTSNSTFARDEAQGIRFASRIPDSQVRQMKEDLNYLARLNFNPAFSASLGADYFTQARQILGIDFSSTANINDAMLSWLKSRVNYVVGESFDLQGNLKVVKNFQTYPNSTENPTIETPTGGTGGGSNVKTVMSNIGAAVYYAGKDGRSLLGLNIPGYGTQTINSPRAGVIKVGEGLFTKGKHTRALPDSSIVHRLSRLTTFFHEARHSDGNGRHLGFFHGICPRGHEFAGYAACDKNRNGPYTVGYLTISAFKANCERSGECNGAEIGAMNALAADALNRVLTTVPNPNAGMDSAVRNAMRTIYEICRDNPSLRASLDDCKDMEALRRRVEGGGDTSTVATSNWNDSPEFAR